MYLQYYPKIPNINFQAVKSHLEYLLFYCQCLPKKINNMNSQWAKVSMCRVDYAAFYWRKGKERSTKAVDDSHPTECDSTLVNSLIPIIVVVMILMMMMIMVMVVVVMMMHLRAASGWNHTTWQWQRWRQAAKCVPAEVYFQSHGSRANFNCASRWKSDSLSQCSEHSYLLPVVMSNCIFYFWKKQKKDTHKMIVYFLEGHRRVVANYLSGSQWEYSNVFPLEDITTAERCLSVGENLG